MAATVAAAGIAQLPTAAIVVALPTIHAEFDASMAELQWTVTAFFIPFTAMLIASGRVADIFGRRRLMLGGVGIFAGGSVVAAVAPGTAVLITGIALSGAGSALFMPASMAIITNVFTGTRRGLAIGMWGAATELISGVGIVIGGVLTGELSWRWIFWMDVVVAAVVVVFILVDTPESRDPTASRHVDLPGVALSAAGLITLSLVLIQGPTWGWTSPVIVVLAIVAAVASVSFVVVERYSRHPLIDLSFFRIRNFSGPTIVIFVLDFSFGAVLFFLPSYFQEVLGDSPVKAGVLLLPLTGVMVVASPIAGRVAAKHDARIPIIAGLALIIAGTYWISAMSIATTYAELWFPTLLIGCGVGFAVTPINLAAINAISRDHTGAASGILVTLSGLGATLGVAVSGGLFQQLLTSRTLNYAQKAGVALSTGQARQLDGLLSGAPSAMSTLQQTAGSKAPELQNAFRQAYVSALGTSLRLSAVLVLVGLVLTLAIMRRSLPAGEPPNQPVLAPPTRHAPRTTVSVPSPTSASSAPSSA